MLLVLPALAADLEASGGADLVAGVVHAADVWSGQATGQVEGALSVTAGAVELGAEIDARFGLAPTVLFALVPERLDIGGEIGPVWMRAGIAPSPWRIEEEDGWDTTLVSWSVEHRRALPGSLLAAELGFGERDAGVSFLGGLDLGAGLDLLGDPGTAITGAPLIAGVHGRVRGQGLALNGGVFAWPDSPAVAGQAGATIDFEQVRLQVQAVGGWNATFGAHVQAELFPEGVATPVLRGELLGALPGGAVGVRVKPVSWLWLKAEVGYADGAPQGWVEVAAWAKTKQRARASR